MIGVTMHAANLMKNFNSIIWSFRVNCRKRYMYSFVCLL